MRLNGCSMAKSRPYRHPDTFRTIIHGDWCIYCGAIATSREHFPPASLTMRGLLLPCCIECNDLAGTESGTDFALRAQIVKNKIKRKYRKALMVPPWGTDELQEMGRTLKGEIRSWQKKRRIIQSRLAWNAESYLASIDKNNAFADLIAECGITTNCEPKLTDSLETDPQSVIDQNE